MTQQVALPPLVNLATAIKADIAQRASVEGEWVDTTLSLAEHLTQARAQHPSNQAFGKWLKDNEIEIGKDDRAALIAFGEQPEEARAVLVGTDSRSLQLIHKNLFRSATNTPKPAEPSGSDKNPADQKPRPKMKKKKDKSERHRPAAQRAAGQRMDTGTFDLLLLW